MYDVETIKQNSDLVSIAELAGAHFHKAGGELRSPCPLHGGDNSSAFAVFDNDTRWACFSHDCGSGDVIEFVMKWKGIDFAAACEWLGGEQESDPARVAQLAEDRVQRQIERLEEEHRKTEMLIAELKSTQTWLRYVMNLEENYKMQSVWEAQGIPPSWQSYWQLGYCPDFTVYSSQGLWHTPSLTIPIFIKDEIQNIRHRLLNPPAPNDKYRPERPGLGSVPFYARSDQMYDVDNILYVEGEKKAMVTFLTLDSGKWQVIGIPGKNQWKREVEKVKGRRVFVLFDPDALDDARQFAAAAGGYYMDLPYKIDDLIIEAGLGKVDIQRYLKTARKGA
jgi:hypothetical protein